MFVYWVLFEVCAGWTGSKEDVQVWNILFFLWKSCAEVHRSGSSSCRTEIEERERDQLRGGTVHGGTGAPQKNAKKSEKKFLKVDPPP